MKNVMKTFVSMALVLTVLLSSLAVFPVSAEEYTTEFLGQNDAPAATHLDPTNPNVSREAKNLLSYLQALTDSNRFIVGTFDISDTNQVYNDVKDQLDAECALYSQRYTIVVEEDFEYEGVSYPPMSFYNHTAVNENLAAHYRNGNVLLIHADTVLEDYMFDYILRTGMAADKAEADQMGFVTNFDATNPDRDPYMYSVLVEHNHNMIEALRELESMGVKAYMYRPWVEFTRFTFHGITQEQREVSRRVWQQTSDLFKASGLTGYLLTWAPQNRWYEHYYWYPGNEYVDVIAPTMYGVPSPEPGMGGYLDTTSHANYEWFIKTGKPYGFSEISCRKAAWESAHADGRQSWYQTLKSIINNYPETTWVNCWADGSYALSNHTNNQPNKGNDDGYLFMNSPFSINLGNLLDYRVTELDSPGVVQLYTEKNYAGNMGETLNNKWIGLEERVYTYKDLKTLGLNPAEIASFHVNAGLGIMFYATDDATGNGWGYLNGRADMSAEKCDGKIRSLQVIRPKLQSQNKTGIYASDCDEEAWKANDGYGSRWTGMVDNKGEGWLVMDLERPCTISRWEVQHASFAGEVDIYNTVDFCLQVSLDGKTWTTVDTVKDNSAGRTNVNLKTPVIGQYFRLFITNPNRVTAGEEQSRMTVAEWKLYGLETGLPAQEANLDALLHGKQPAKPEDTTSEPAEDEQPEDTTSEPSENEQPEVDSTPEEDTVPDEGTTSDEETLPEDEPVEDIVPEGGETVPDVNLLPEEDDGDDEFLPENDGDEDESGVDKKKPIKVITTVTYFPWWAWLLMALGVLVAGGVVVFILLRRKKKKAEQAEA